MNDINTYVGEMRAKYITGEESLDTFDDFVETMLSMRLERAIEIQTAGYDRYKSR